VREGKSEWGYAYLYPARTIPEKVVKWIKIARNFSSQSQGEDEETGEDREENKKTKPPEELHVADLDALLE
jgi:hypothetical protein